MQKRLWPIFSHSHDPQTLHAWKDQDEQLIISTFFSSSSLSLFFCLQDNDVVEDGTTDTDFALHTFTSPPKIDAEPCS